MIFIDDILIYNAGSNLQSGNFPYFPIVVNEGQVVSKNPPNMSTYGVSFRALLVDATDGLTAITLDSEYIIPIGKKMIVNLFLLIGMMGNLQ